VYPVVKGTRQARLAGGWGPSEAGECAQGGPTDTMRRRRWSACRSWVCALNERQHHMAKEWASQRSWGVCSGRTLRHHEAKKVECLSKLGVCSERTPTPYGKRVGISVKLWVCSQRTARHHKPKKLASRRCWGYAGWCFCRIIICPGRAHPVCSCLASLPGGDGLWLVYPLGAASG
jgi:hypothetical protein